MARNISYTSLRQQLKSEGIILTDRMIPAFKKSIAKIGGQKTLEKYRSSENTIHIIRDMNIRLQQSTDPEEIANINRRFADKTFMKNVELLEHSSYDKAFKERFTSFDNYTYRYDWREGLIDSLSRTLFYRVDEDTFNEFKTRIRNLSVFKDRQGIDEYFAERKYFYKNVTLDETHYKKFLGLLGYSKAEQEEIWTNTEKGIIED